MLLINDDRIKVEALELGVWLTNAYVVTCKRTGEGLLIDAPAEAGVILAAMQGMTPRYILVTHRHGDHTGALAELQSKLRVPVAAHEADAGSLPVAADQLLRNGDIVRAGDLALAVLHTPGHTPGSLCFRCGNILFAGDTIYPGGPGNTKSPEDFRQIVASLRQKILVLPDDTLIYPGHGKPTVLKKEKEQIAVFDTRKRAADVCGDVLWLAS